MGVDIYKNLCIAKLFLSFSFSCFAVLKKKKNGPENRLTKLETKIKKTRLAFSGVFTIFIG